MGLVHFPQLNTNIPVSRKGTGHDTTPPFPQETPTAELQQGKLYPIQWSQTTLSPCPSSNFSSPCSRHLVSEPCPLRGAASCDPGAVEQEANPPVQGPLCTPKRANAEVRLSSKAVSGFLASQELQAPQLIQVASRKREFKRKLKKALSGLTEDPGSWKG